MEALTFGTAGPLTMLLFTFHGDEREVLPVGERMVRLMEQDPTTYDASRVVVVLQVNPDGWALETRQNARSVDLNRNYPVGWEASEPGSVYYSGPSPLSEPESIALANLIDQLKPDRIVSVHQPFDWLDPDGERSLDLARAMSQASGMGFPNRPMKPTPGSFGKYCASKGIAVVTLEMPEIDASRLDEYWSVTRDALLAAIRFPMA